MTKYEKSLQETIAVREQVPADLRALFDHCVHLAKDSHARGYFKRAGRELRAARRLVNK